MFIEQYQVDEYFDTLKNSKNIIAINPKDYMEIASMFTLKHPKENLDVIRIVAFSKNNSSIIMELKDESCISYDYFSDSIITNPDLSFLDN